MAEQTGLPGETEPERMIRMRRTAGKKYPDFLPRSLLVGGFEVPLVWDGARARLFGADCAKEVLGWFESKHPLDMRLREALVAIRENAWGRVTEETLAEARRGAAEASYGVADVFAECAANAVAAAAHQDPKQAAQDAGNVVWQW